MAGDELAQVAAQLASALGDSSLLVGGMAVAAWGHVRATEDVDFICSSRPDDIKRMLGAAGIASQLRRGDVLEGDIPWVVTGELHGISFRIFPPVVPMDWKRGLSISLPDGSELRVVDLEDLLHLKLKAGGALDLWDVAMLVQEHPGKLDRARRLAKTCGVLDELERWLSDPRLKKP